MNSSLEDSHAVFAVPLPDPVTFNLLEAIDHHATNNQKHPLFRYEDIDGTIRVINWGQAVQAFDTASQFVGQCVQTESPLKNGGAPLKVIGILANLDSITYYSLLIGIMIAGFTPFPISVRNSAEAIAHLMAETKCDTLFTSDDPTTQQLAVSAISLLEKGGLLKTSAKMYPAPTFERLYTKAATDSKRHLPRRKILDQTTTPCVILHSSGTISFPKPITLTYSMVLQHATLYRDEGDLLGRALSAHALPLYHLMGFTMIPWSTILGITLCVFRPSKPAIIPSPDLVLRSAIATFSSLIYCASSFLENWAIDPSNVESLKTFDKVMFAGGPLQINIGDSLVGQGVKLLPVLGLTELGMINSFSPRLARSEGWSWYEADASIDVVLVPEDEVKNIFRLVVKENAFKTPATFNTVIDGVQAFDTKDLVIVHPTNPRLWQVYGRADEQIMHSTGEKTNPVPIEAMLSKSPYISAALMFGRARFQPGVLIFPHPDWAFDPSDRKRLHDYVELIWDVVITANRRSPQHSRIFKEMIMIADPQKQVEYTVKGTIRRQITLSKYEREIEQLYEVTKTSNAVDIQILCTREPDNISTFLRFIVRDILGQTIGDDDDIFEIGADSLCALSIRNSITLGLQQSGILSDETIRAFPRDFVYIYPSICKMSAFLCGATLVEAVKLQFSIAVNARSEKELTSQIEKNSSMDKASILDLRWQRVLESRETVTELVPGDGEPPFIIIHGAGGDLDVFPTFMKYTSAVWAIQVVEDTPQDSLEEVAAFYYNAIKAKQPHGPYRIGAFSGSSLILVELVSLVERNGDEVIQFAMLDHFPTWYFPDFRPEDVQISNAQWMEKYIQSSLRRILDLLFSKFGKDVPPQMLLRADELKKATYDLQGTPGARQWIKRLATLHRMSLKYLMRKDFLQGHEGGSNRWSAELFREFTITIKARLTVYVAKEGVKVMLPEGLKEHKEDLGARSFFPNAHIVSVDGDHMTFMGNQELRKSIEGEYYKEC